MHGASRYIDLISGRRRGASAALARGFLAALEPIYGTAVRLRNYRYDRPLADIHRIDVPVISVGNLTLGGTGKTPMVKWIARWLRDRRLRVALVSRGYGAERGAPNDEALELAQALPGVQHLQNPDRVAAACQAVADYAAQVVLLDDGFQHRRLSRDLDIVLLDAQEPFGFGHLLPRGALREPVTALQRAQVVCLSRADQVDAIRRDEVRDRVRELVPNAIWCETAHRPQHLIVAAGNAQPIEALRGQRVAAFCGIGNPAAFRSTLNDAGCTVVAWREYPDHYAFTANDVVDLSNWASSLSIDTAVCTHKDFVKVPVEYLGPTRLLAVVVELDFLSGKSDFEAAIARSINGANKLRAMPAA